MIASFKIFYEKSKLCLVVGVGHLSRKSSAFMK
jgi:hypothetical protein